MITNSDEFIQKVDSSLKRAIVEPSSIWKADKLTRYIVAKAFSENVYDVSELIQNLKTSPAFNHFSQSNSIFPEGFKKHIRFECSTKKMTLDLLKKYKGFNVSDVDKFQSYLPREDYDSLIPKWINNGKNVLIQGPPDTGKTRLAYEVLKRLDGYYVFSLYQSYAQESEKFKFSSLSTNDDIKLIWFIDDLHFINEQVQKIYEKLIYRFENLTIVATQKSGTSLPDAQIFQSMKIVRIELWTEKDLAQLAKINSISLIHKRGNTPSSIINDFDKLQNIYNRFKIDDNDCFLVLQYLKLLSTFLETVDYELLEKVFICFRKGMSNKNDFEKAIFKLKEDGFLKIQEGHFSYKDSLFSEIITDKDYHNKKSDLTNLISLLPQLKRSRELFLLGSYYFSINEFGFHIKCNKTIIKNIENVKDYNLGVCAYIDLGNTLILKAAAEKTQKDLFEACNVFNDASHYIKTFEYVEEYFSKIFKCWGIALNDLSNSTGQIKFSKEACEKFEAAESYQLEDYWAYYHWASALEKIGFFYSDASFLHEACEKYQLAAQGNSIFEGIYHDWGIVLDEVASLTGNIHYCTKACEKFKLACEIKNDSSSTYFKWGESLTKLGYYYEDPIFFEDACKKYKVAISIKIDFVEAHFNCGILFNELAQMDIETESNYLEACISFERVIRYQKDHASAYYHWGVALMGVGFIYLDKIYFKKAASKFKLATIHQEDYGHAYFSWSVALVNLNILNKRREYGGLILDNLYRAYFLLIIEEEWEVAHSLAKEYFLSSGSLKEQNTDFYNVFFIFNVALVFLLKPKAILHCDFKELKEFGETNKTEPITIVINAIIEGKEPESEYEVDNNIDKLILDAAIYLAQRLSLLFPKAI